MKHISKSNRCAILAAILNFIIPGLGYLYIGKRKIFAILLIIGFVLMGLGVLYLGFNTLNSWFGLLTVFVIHLAFAYDAYFLAKEHHNRYVT